MTPDVDKAIEEIRNTLPDNRIEVIPEEQGGAFIIAHDVDLGDVYEPTKSWIGFRIDFQYPRSDVYPHYLDSVVERKDRQPLGAGISGPITWQNRQVWQLSRKSRQWDINIDTAATKLAQVLEWLRTR